MTRRLAAILAVMLFATVACSNWRAAEDAYCEKEGSFCFDAGDADGPRVDSGTDPDAGVPDAGAADASVAPDAGFLLELSVALSATNAAVDIRAVAAPAARLYLAAGEYRSIDTIQFDESAAPATGQTDAFVLWIDRTTLTPKSRLLTLSSGSDEAVTAVAAQSSTEGYAAGTHSSALKLGKTSTFLGATDGGGLSSFIVRFGGNAEPVWGRPIADYTTGRFTPTGLTPFPGGPVLIGTFTGNTVIGGKSYAATSSDHGFIGAVDPDGGFTWTSWFECEAMNNSWIGLASIDQGAAGTQLGVAGAVNGACTLHDTAGTDTVFFGGGLPERAFFARLDADGGLLNRVTSSSSAAATDRSRFTSLSIVDGRVALTGEFEGTLAFGTQVVAADAGTLASFITVLDPANKPQFLLPITSTGVVRSPRIMQRVDGAILVAGTFTGTLSVPGFTAVASPPDPDVFLLSADAMGNVRALTSFNAGAPDGILTSADALDTELILGGRHLSSFTVEGQSVPGNNDAFNPGSYLLVLRPDP